MSQSTRGNPNRPAARSRHDPRRPPGRDRRTGSPPDAGARRPLVGNTTVQPYGTNVVPRTVRQWDPRPPRDVLPSSPPQSSSSAYAHRLPEPTHSDITSGIGRASSGESRLVGFDKNTKVQTILQDEPKAQITDPQLLNKGIQVRYELQSGGSNNEEIFDESYKRRPRKFFRPGRVLAVLWVEPATGNVTKVTPAFSETRFGQLAFAKVRRFIIIRTAGLSCTALAITTNGFRGALKPGAEQAEYGIVYTSKDAPDRLRGETSMQPHPIRVNPDTPTDQLHKLSRIHYSEFYTIHHNLRVKPIGNVAINDFRELLAQCGSVWALHVNINRDGRQLTLEQSRAYAEHHNFAGAITDATVEEEEEDEEEDEEPEEAGSEDEEEEPGKSSDGRSEDTDDPEDSEDDMAATQQGLSRLNMNQSQSPANSDPISNAVRTAIAALVDQGLSRERAALLIRQRLARSPPSGQWQGKGKDRA